MPPAVEAGTLNHWTIMEAPPPNSAFSGMTLVASLALVGVLNLRNWQVLHILFESQLLNIYQHSTGQREFQDPLFFLPLVSHR